MSSGTSHDPFTPAGDLLVQPRSAVIGGRYLLLSLLGVGGMGAVYRVRDQTLDEIVALKLMKVDPDDPDRLERFRREVKLARKVTHRNVARTFDVGEHGTDLFLTMEYIEGESLAARLAREGAMPVSKALHVARSLCEGLRAAHDAGVIHRDLKPENVLLGAGDRVVITDFGIARAADSPDREHAVVGTPAYMAPEQVQGTVDIDARADLYALGAVLYEVLTGVPAWPGPTAFAVATARLRSPPPDPRARNPEIPAAVAALVLACLARRRDDRPPSAAALLLRTEDAIAALTSDGVTAAPSGISMRAERVAPLPNAAKTVAVLPFQARAGDEPIAEELTEDLNDRLSMTRGLLVRHVGSPRGASAERADARAVGQSLGVQLVVEGSLRRNGDAVRISARAISVEDGFQLWAQRFEGPLETVLAMNDRVATAVAAALTVDWRVAERAPLAGPRALDLYVLAQRALRARWSGTGDLSHAVALFDEALSLAPDDPGILAGAARARARHFNYLRHDRAAMAERARALAARAMELAPHLGEPWLALATIEHVEGAWPAAVRSLRAALARSPGLVRAHELLGAIQLEVGPIEDAGFRLETARSLDPTSTYARIELVRAAALSADWGRFRSLLAGPFEAAEDRVLARIAGLRLGLWAGLDAADGDDPPTPPDLRPLIDGLRAAHAGDGGGAILRVEEFLRNVPPSSRLRLVLLQSVAEVALRAGDRERALSALEEAASLGLQDEVWLDRCPVLAPLRDGARFEAAAAQVRARAAQVRAALG